jgi:hypothetical protein
MMASGNNLEEWLFVAGYLSFLVFVVGAVIASTNRQD